MPADIFVLGDSLTVQGIYNPLVAQEGHNFLAEAQGGWGAFAYLNTPTSPLKRNKSTISVPNYWAYKTGGVPASRVLLMLWTNDLHPSQFTNLTPQEKAVQCFNSLEAIAAAFTAAGSEVTITFPLAPHVNAPSDFKLAVWHLAVLLTIGENYPTLSTAFTNNNYADTYHPNAAGYAQIAASIIDWLGA